MSDVKPAIAIRDELIDRYANCDAARHQDWNHARVVLEALMTACERLAELEAEHAEDTAVIISQTIEDQAKRIARLEAIIDRAAKHVLASGPLPPFEGALDAGVEALAKKCAELEAELEKQQKFDQGTSDLIDGGVQRIAALEEREKALLKLLEEPMNNSATTTGDHGGPGCFFCDTQEGHAKDCRAVKVVDDE